MKAAQYTEYGDPEVIQIVETDKPTPKDSQLLIQVKAAAINPFDAKLRQGTYQESIPLTFPVTIGADFSGVISAVPADVTIYKIGDEVYGSANVLNGGSGAVAEYLTANAKNIALKPSNVNFEQAAAVVLVGVSAVQALDQLNLSQGKKILIHGGAGGIGSAAIQYAKHLGAYVATTAKGSDKDFVTSLGADEVIDFETQKFDEILSDIDAVFDTVGGETYARSFNILKSGGTVISMLEQPNQQLMTDHDVTALPMSSKVHTDSLDRLAQLVNDGTIKPQIDSEYSLDQAVDAFKKLETGSPKGKVVIKIG